MQQPDTLRRVLQLGLGTIARGPLTRAFVAAPFAMTLGAAPAAVYAAAAQPTQVGAASYDRVSERLSIPVKGGVPRVVVRRLAPRQYVADLAGSVLLGGEAQGQRLRSPALAGWSLDEEPGSKTVRLRMTLTTDVQPKVRFDRKSGGYVVAFATPADEEPVRVAKPAAKPVAAKPVVKPIAAKPIAKPAAIAVKAIEKPVTAKAAPVKPVETTVAAAAKPAEPVLAKKPVAWPVKPSKPAVTTAAAKPAPIVKVPTTIAAKPAPAVKAAAPIAVKKTVAPALTRSEVEGRLATRRVPAPKPIAAKPVVATVTSTPVRAPRPQVHQTFVGQQASATLGAPKWDAEQGLLVLPIESGSLRARDFDVYKLSARWSFMDIPHAKPGFAGVKYEQRQDKLFQRWVMAKRPGRDTTRISFALGQPAHIDVEVADREVRIAVRPDAPMLGAAPKPAAVVATEPTTTTTTAAQTPVTAPVQAAPKPVGKKPVASKPVTKPVAVTEVPVAIETRMRRPFFDAERFGLVIPYEGRTPLYRWRQKDEGTAILELKADVVNPTHLQPEARRHGDFGTWTFDRPAKPGMLAIDMNFARPSEIVVAADPERKQLLLIPQPRLHEENARETAPAHTSLATVAMEAGGDNLFIPFDGSVPRYTIEQVNNSFAYINFERAALQNDGVQFYAPDYHPTLNYWMVTQPAGTTTVRIAVALARPGAAAVFQDKANGRLVIAMGGSSPLGVASGARTPRLPDPWPGAAKPAAPQETETKVETSTDPKAETQAEAS